MREGGGVCETFVNFIRATWPPGYDTYLEVYIDHDGGWRPEGDDAGEDGEVLVHHEVAAVAAVLPIRVDQNNN